jgi:hypothetical protein
VEPAVSRLSRTLPLLGLLALSGLLDVTLGTASFGADLKLLPKRSIIHVPASHGAAKAEPELRLEEFAKGPNAACTAWTDGCRSCGKGPDGVFCSNVGIACQPSAPRCSSP